MVVLIRICTVFQVCSILSLSMLYIHYIWVWLPVKPSRPVGPLSSYYEIDWFIFKTQKTKYYSIYIFSWLIHTKFWWHLVCIFHRVQILILKYKKIKEEEEFYKWVGIEVGRTVVRTLELGLAGQLHYSIAQRAHTPFIN